MNHVLSICIFSSCLLVKGSSKAVIIDIQRDKLINIPIHLYEILVKYNKQSLNYITLEEPEIDKNTLIKYLNYLETLEVVFYSDVPECFPDLTFEFSFPSSITNAIINISDLTPFFKLISLIKELNSFNCKKILFIINTNLTFTNLKNIFEEITLSSIENVDVFVNSTVSISCIKYLNKHICVSNIVLWSLMEINMKFEKVAYIKDKFSFKKCGQIDIDSFNNHMYFISESHHHNSCLNRKISIDAEGNIKNCPSMTESFGNIRDTTLAEALEKPGFKKYWDINKDKIHVCKDCEFRYICTDCRAYVEDPEDILSKPLKCGYNPYTGEWSEWSTNPLKQKAIDFYGMREMVDDMKKAETPE